MSFWNVLLLDNTLFQIKDVISESEDHYEKVFTIGVKAFDKCLSSNKDTISRHLTGQHSSSIYIYLKVGSYKTT